MIRPCERRDFDEIWTIVNDGAQAYRGVIPADRWEDPYMSRAKLLHEIDNGVVFSAFEQAGALAGVMGLQKVQDVTLIRHAYVRTASQKQGIGAALLAHLRQLTGDPVLIGTWADALWAIRFYQHHDFAIVSSEEKNILLKKYWSIPHRQVETSIVLADQRWRQLQQPTSESILL
jgi:GNAT superfamily N-acetyltransferase